MTAARLLTAPREFLAGDPTEAEKRRVFAVVLATGLVPTLGAIVGVTVLLSGQFGAGLVGFVVLVALLAGAALAVGSWLLWTGALFVLARLFGGEGSTRGLLFDVGWGFLPRLVAVVVGVVPPLLGVGRLEPVTVDPGGDPQAFGQAIGESAAAGGASPELSLVAWAVALLALFASARVWVAAVEENMALERGQALVVVGVPVVVSVLTRLVFGLLPLVGRL
jgi:hypothetical protein